MKNLEHAFKDIKQTIANASNNKDSASKGFSMQNKSDNSTKFYRFQVYTTAPGKKPKVVGMAYLKEGQSIYSLRLWTFLNEKFYLLRSKDDNSKFLVMTREANKNVESKNKYFWNIVGNGVTLIKDSSIELAFDLFDKKIYMNLFPDESLKPSARYYPDQSEAA